MSTIRHALTYLETKDHNPKTDAQKQLDLVTRANQVVMIQEHCSGGVLMDGCSQERVDALKREKQAARKKLKEQMAVRASDDGSWQAVTVLS